jgi:cbb3-type cytochrome oxidase maturation protein
MDTLILTMFVSLVLAAGGLAMFVWLAGARTFDHADRLALLPIEDDAPVVPSPSSPIDHDRGSR